MTDHRERVLIVAEIASSHEGRPDLAIRLTQDAARAGADAVKFQLFRAGELVVSHHPKAASFREIELTPRAWGEVIAAARAEGLGILADVYDVPSLELAEELGVHGYKITTTIAGDPVLLPKLAATGKPLLLAVSPETEDEIRKLLSLLGKRPPNDPVLLHGFQGFPTRLEDTHLNRLLWLRKRFGLPVGFADHCPADLAVASVLPVVAVGLGARVIEKHLTWDRSAKGRDHVSALNPDEFAQMVSWIRAVEPALGEPEPAVTEAEIHYRATMQKKVVARVAVPSGTVVGFRQLGLKRTLDPGVDPLRFDELLGKKTLRALLPDETVRPEELVDPVAVVLVAVRMKSTRLPGKALLPLAGKPVLAHLVERVRQARLPRLAVICASVHPDDQVLLDWAARLGVLSYAGSEDDVMDRFLKAADREGADVVVRVTGDNPLTDPEAIDAMIQHHCREGADYTYTEDLPRGTRPEVISVPALRRAHELAEDPSGSEYMTLYFKRHPEVFAMARWEASEAVRRPQYRLTLDTPEDLELLRRVYEGLYREGEVLSLEEAVRLLDAHPEWVAINSHIEPRVPPGINARLRIPR